MKRSTAPLLSIMLVMGLCMALSSSVLAEEATSDSAAEDIARWATIKEADGPEGRPLPLTASWVPGGMFGMKSLVQMIRDGHHVLPTIRDPKFGAVYHYLLQNNEGPPTPDSHHLGSLARLEPEFQYLREHDLPFAMMGNNWAAGVTGLEKQYQREANKHNRREFSPEESARLMVEKDGDIVSGSWKLASPFAPDDAWARFGRWWGGNPAIQWIQDVYPDPPMVVWLNNNEGGEMRLKHLNRSVRFRREYGDEDLSKDEKQQILHAAYDRKYEVLFDTVRDALIEPAWKKNSRFVAYNAWPRSVKGRTEERNHRSEWKRYDGAMPEFYLNDWQIGRGKTDYNYWSPQTEGLRIQSSQDVIFGLAPDYYFASIAWEGGPPAKRRSAINCLATGMYGSGAVQRWDFARYEGMVQFGLWAMRPRVMREFRYPVSKHDAYDKGAFMAVVDAVDRVWENEILAEFWRFGELVKSEKFRPPNKKVAEQLRFYSRVDSLLPVDVNPPRDEWPRIWHFKAHKRPPVRLRVLALALKLGEKPNRRWLIYAHAPLGAVEGPKVTLPDYGEVALKHVARSGSFFLFNEADGSLETVVRGGPPEIGVNAEPRFVEPGETVQVTAEATRPPEEGFESCTWSAVDSNPSLEDGPVTRELKPETPGLHMIRVTGTTADGREIADDAPVFVGDKPDDAVVYDLELSDASVWRGPWGGVGKDKRELLTYRMVPNPGGAPDIVLHGGEFVEDADLDRRVLELSGDDDGLWGVRSDLTCNRDRGHPDLTISMRFKPETLEGTQVLYVQGGRGKGFNVYIQDGTLYAGSLSHKQDWGEFDERDGKYRHWLSTDSVEAGRWQRVTLVLKDATENIQKDRLLLYLDGEKVGSGPGVRIPNHHAGPRIGVARTTTLHSGENVSQAGFRGRIADFRQLNRAEVPGAEEGGQDRESGK